MHSLLKCSEFMGLHYAANLLYIPVNVQNGIICFIYMTFLYTYNENNAYTITHHFLSTKIINSLFTQFACMEYTGVHILDLLVVLDFLHFTCP